MKANYKDKTITLSENELSDITFNMLMGLVHLSKSMRASTGKDFERYCRLHEKCGQMIDELQHHTTMMIERDKEIKED